MVRLICFLGLAGLILSCTQSDKPDVANEEYSKIWRAQLLLSDAKEKIKLPFIFEFDVNESKPSFVIINGQEKITLDNVTIKGDSIWVSMDPYDSRLELKIDGKNIKGVWRNLAKGPNYMIPFVARNGTKIRFLDPRFSEMDASGRYKLNFGNSIDGFEAIGEFTQEGNVVTGTIRTETGDYRFLEGRQCGNEMYLSCFDGSHAFLFHAHFQKGNLIDSAVFYSGTHYTENWKGAKNDTFQLRNPDSLTVLTSDSGLFAFEIPMKNGDTLSQNSGRFNDKPVIVQIMGTWCPNCKDETEFLKETSKKYGKKLEIIAVCFEYGDKQVARKRIDKYIDLMGVEYPMIYGGLPKNEVVTERFKTLNEIISYPTLVVLDKNKQIKKIHTGFNGPATSQYDAFKSDMTQLLDSLTQ
ncbi:MAG: TlpA disulfide reductase family protein [Salibacteraceae bacterium]